MSKDLMVVGSDAFERMENVAELHIQGIGVDTIARRLSITRVEVKNAIAQWQEIINNDLEARDAAKDHLSKMIVHYDRLIADLSDNLDNLKTLVFDEKVSNQIVGTNKAIADLVAKRLDALQKAGLLDAHDLGDELAEREEREAMLIEILRNDLCPECKRVVAVKLQQLTKQAEVVVEFDE